MSNCLFAYPDRTLTATLSTTGTAWLSALPLSNLTDRLLSRVARSAGVTTAHTKFDITLPAATPIRVLALLRHNLSAAATVKLSFGTTLGGATLGTVSGLPVWTPFYPDGSNLSAGDVAAYSPAPDFWYVLPATVSPQYIRVEITDTANPAGFIQLGRCLCAPAFQPQANLDYGSTFAWQQDVVREQSLGGVEWFEIRSAGREIGVTLSHLSIAEGMVQVFDRQRRLGLEGEVYFIYDPADTCILYKQRAMLARFSDADPMKNPYFGATSSSFNLTEVR